MPSVRKHETKKSYLKRAIPELRKEGKSEKAAVGQSEAMYAEKWTSRKKKTTKKAVKKK